MPFKTRYFYKCIRADGTDLFTGTINYVEAIGYCIYVPEPMQCDPPQIGNEGILHASPTICQAFFVARDLRRWSPYEYATPYYRLIEVWGTPVTSDRRPKPSKYGFFEFDVIREVKKPDEIVYALSTYVWNKSVNGRWVPQSMSEAAAKRTYDTAFRPRRFFDDAWGVNADV